MSLAERERQLGGRRLITLRTVEDAAATFSRADDLDEAAFASRVLKAIARRTCPTVAVALHRTHRALLRELYHEGIITREEAGLRAPRRSRIG